VPVQKSTAIGWWKDRLKRVSMTRFYTAR